jgi:hypothetical protein
MTSDEITRDEMTVDEKPGAFFYTYTYTANLKFPKITPAQYPEYIKNRYFKKHFAVF